MNKLVTIVSFSSRNNGNCANIGKYLANYHSNDQVKIITVNGESVQPCNNCNYECLTPGANCPMLNDRQTEIMDAICSSDLIYMIVPNYCGYPSANYFAFNERSVGYFHMDRTKMNKYMEVPKRFIIVSNTEGFEAAMRQQTNKEPKILYLKSGKYKKRSTAGDIMESPEAQADLLAFLAKDTD